jgi:branched-chain amino acid transport system substrate-binding protein
MAIALAISVPVALFLSAYATGAGTSPAAKPAAAKVVQAAPATKCGLGNGKKASGAPIKLGGIFTLVPGVDFTTTAASAAGRSASRCTRSS